MPKLVYNLIKDGELRKKLTAVGLPTNGNRQVYIYIYTKLNVNIKWHMALIDSCLTLWEKCFSEHDKPPQRVHSDIQLRM